MSFSVISTVNAKRIFAVGDLHGCPDEPEILLKYLVEEEGLTDEDVVIFLGDYIDRGPKSSAVVDLMLDFQRRFPKSRFLKGNHEDMLLDFLGFGGRLGQAFLYNGGLETIQSYGISVFSPPQEMVNTLPPKHFKFYCELESIIKIDEFIFAHAGLNPLMDLEAQSDGDVFWIREEFISNVHPFNATVIFGHTPHREILLHLPYKIGLDTGLVFGNKLSCIELRSGKLLQIGRDRKEVIKSYIDLVPVLKDRF